MFNQMPIVDGLTSTKMIRSHEKTNPASRLSLRASANGRVPIFAVSASLVERERQTYINAGFDGWILKPIDFKRLNVLLLGIVQVETRESCLYRPGSWEKGGWFNQSQPSVTRASTFPSEKNPVQLPPPKQEVLQPDKDSLGSSESGSITPTRNEPRRPLVYDERLDPPRETEAETELDVQAVGDQLAEQASAIEDRELQDVTEETENEE